MTLGSKLWHVHEGKPIYLFRLTGENVEMKVSNYGCVVQSIIVSGKKIPKRNIVLGYKTAGEYIADGFYTGCILGRYAGRISPANYVIDEECFPLTINEQGSDNHLHGGFHGFNKKVFDIADQGVNEERCFIRLNFASPHLEEGHPGKLAVSVLIELNRSNEITIAYEATTTMPTHANLSHHHYFNLTGAADRALHQELVIHADHYLEQDDRFVPTGTAEDLKKSTFDFSGKKLIKDAAEGKMLNEYYILNKKAADLKDASLTDPVSGLTMDISTTYPCIVLYTGNFLDNPFMMSQGICLETQFFPNSPHQPTFPSTLLLPGSNYRHHTKMTLKNIN